VEGLSFRGLLGVSSARSLPRWPEMPLPKIHDFAFKITGNYTFICAGIPV
jgi:hypothetical protein